MKTTVLGIAVTLGWCVAAPLAQQQPATPKPPAHNVFVVTGCLNTPAQGATAFKLTDAKSIGRDAPPPAVEAGAVGTSGVTTKPAYDLQPASGVNAQGMDADALKAHAGQRVEVTLRPTQSTVAPAPSAGASIGVQASKPIDAPPAQFSVTAIKRVDGACP
jgi:hypothetical protein